MAHAPPHLASLVRTGCAWARGTLGHGTRAVPSSVSGLASEMSPAAAAAFRTAAGSAAASSSFAATPAAAAAAAAAARASAGAGARAASGEAARAAAGAAAGAASNPFLAHWRGQASALATVIGGKANGCGTSLPSALAGKSAQAGHTVWRCSLPAWQVGQDAARPSIREFVGGAAEAVGSCGGWQLLHRAGKSAGLLAKPLLRALHTGVEGNGTHKTLTGQLRHLLPALALRAPHVVLRPPSAPGGAGLRRHLSTASASLSSGAASVPLGRIATVKVLGSTSPLVVGTARTQQAVAGWLFGCAAWTFAMVVLGGVTRLTRSGLSMTDWKFGGGLPPLTDEDWAAEFEKYKRYPEYKRVNKGISLEDFKWIYWMEYAHRMWGRALGLLFGVPFVVFLARRSLSRPLVSRLLLLFGMGGAQGFVGWWMVKSGLEEPADEHTVPRVSPYRLAAHLTSAFIIYSLILWTGLTVAMPRPPAETALQLAAAARARALAHPVAALVGVTAISGAFVAGNDAGRAYNNFPMMGDHWVPPTEELFPFAPFHRNFFESTATVQLQHRLLALSTLGAVGTLFVSTRSLPLHPTSRLLVSAALGVTALQVTLGISTLLTYVPVSLGSAHQAGALTLFTVMLMLLHSLRRPKPALAGLHSLHPDLAARRALASPQAHA